MIEVNSQYVLDLLLVDRVGVALDVALVDERKVIKGLTYIDVSTFVRLALFRSRL